MRLHVTLLLCVYCLGFAVGGSAAQTPVTATQTKPAPQSSGPADPKAKKTYDDALKLLNEHQGVFALDGFRKADKQDGGHCVPCEFQAWKVAVEIRDFKAAREQSEAILTHVTNPLDKAQAQVMLGRACLAEGIYAKHSEPMESADAAFRSALELQPGNTDCLYEDGTALAYLKRDDAAKARFLEFLKVASQNDVDYQRAQRFAERPELARARMAPNFRVTTLDGTTLTLESLSGKVVLIDFWATWCGPCREALPHIKRIASAWRGQPLVVLSISLDKDDAKWRDFVGKNEMTWLQYRDGGFEGNIAKQFGVTAIPATFTIDADGVLEDQHVGDADIEGKLKKLVTRAAEANNRKLSPVIEGKALSGAN
jgi:thiol-disulfide isomerase/thioredoxin